MTTSRRSAISNAADAGKAFSLVELLVVLAVIGLLAVLTVPAVVSSLSGTRLTTAGQSVQDALLLARQTAVTRGATVEVRWFKSAGDGDPTPRYRALQTFLVTSGTVKPLDRGLKLPTGVVVSEVPNLSPFLNSTNHVELPVPAGLPVPGGGMDSKYRAFRFSSHGSVDLAAGENHLTLVPERTADQATHANFVTLQIEPVSGNVREFRP